MIVIKYSVLALFICKDVRYPSKGLTFSVAGNECVTVIDKFMVSFTLRWTLAGQETCRLAVQKEGKHSKVFTRTHIHDNYDDKEITPIFASFNEAPLCGRNNPRHTAFTCILGLPEDWEMLSITSLCPDDNHQEQLGGLAIENFILLEPVYCSTGMVSGRNNSISNPFLIFWWCGARYGIWSHDSLWLQIKYYIISIFWCSCILSRVQGFECGATSDDSSCCSCVGSCRETCRGRL